MKVKLTEKEANLIIKALNLHDENIGSIGRYVGPSSRKVLQPLHNDIDALKEKIIVSWQADE